MARLPYHGGAYLTPHAPVYFLARIAVIMRARFGCEIKCTADQKKSIMERLAVIIGMANAEKEMPSSTDVLRQLQHANNSIDRIQPLLTANKKGFSTHTAEQREAGQRLFSAFSEIPGTGSFDDAVADMIDLSDRLSIVQQSIDVAIAELKDHKGKAGRGSLTYYDEFTDLLVTLCGQARLSTKLARGVDGPLGPLYTLAVLMEVFLPEELRPESEEARFKRLDRSLKRMRRTKSPTK